MTQYKVIESDDEGERELLSGARTAGEAARRAAALVPGIDPVAFASSWNATNRDESARYTITDY